MEVDMKKISPELKLLMEGEGFSFLNTVISLLPTDFIGELTTEQNNVTLTDKNGTVRFQAGTLDQEA